MRQITCHLPRALRLAAVKARGPRDRYAARRNAVSTRVLIVDDDETLRESLELFLASEDYEVVAAADGADRRAPRRPVRVRAA